MRLQDLLSPRHRRFVRQQAPCQGTSLSAMAWQRFCRNRLSVASLVVIGLFAVVAILGYLITPDHTPHCNQQYLELATLKPFSTVQFTYVDDGLPQPRHNPLRRMLVGEPLAYTAIPTYRTTAAGDSLDIEGYTGSVPNDGPVRRVAQSQVIKSTTRTFLLGTDAYGRDVLSMLMIGSRVSLSVGFIALLIALLIGITLGALAAYHGGWVDNLVTWLINVVWSIPTVLLVIAITFALGKGFWQVFVAVGLTMWVDIARVVRGQVYSVKEKEYVEAARALGYSSFRCRHRRGGSQLRQCHPPRGRPQFSRHRRTAPNALVGHHGQRQLQLYTARQCLSGSTPRSRHHAVGACLHAPRQRHPRCAGCQVNSLTLSATPLQMVTKVMITTSS